MPLVRRTRATLRSAEFGFFGVWVKTRTQTPRFCGLFCSAGLFVFVRTFSRPLRTNWLIVGTGTPSKKKSSGKKRHEPSFAGVRCPRPRSRYRGPAPGAGLPYKVYGADPVGRSSRHDNGSSCLECGL